MTHTNRRLMELATKNAQSIAANEFIASLPVDLHEFFSQATRIYYPELSGFLAPVVSRASREQADPKQATAGTHINLTSSWETAWRHFQAWAAKLPPGDYVLVVGGGNGYKFDQSVSWISKLPGFLARIPGILDKLELLPGLRGSELLLSSADGTHVVLMEAYSGFLEEEPSPAEMVYETTAWGLG